MQNRKLPGFLALGIPLFLGILLAPFFIFLLFSAGLNLMGVIYPGVMVGPVSVGWLTPQDAAEELTRAYNVEREMVAEGDGKYWAAKPVEFGLLVDGLASAQRAYEVGRGPDALAELLKLLARGQVSVLPVVQFQATQARRQLEGWAPMVSQPGSPPTLAFQNGRWTVVSTVAARELDLPESLSGLQLQADTIIASGVIHLAFKDQPPSGGDMAALTALAAQMNRPLKVTAYDPIQNETLNWTVPLETLAPWVQVDGSKTPPQVALNEDALFGWLGSQNAQLGTNRTVKKTAKAPAAGSAWLAGQSVTYQIWHNPTEYVVQAGDNLTQVSYRLGMPYWKILQANPGLDQNQLLVGTRLVIPSKNELLPLPVIANKRIVISIPQQRMRIYENGAQKAEYVISTGIASSPTMPGIFQVQTHDPNAYASVWDLTMPNFLGIYEAWPGFMNGIHGLPTLSSGVRLWANVLGRPASYGCIILSLKDADTVYRWAENGVVVEIQP